MKAFEILYETLILWREINKFEKGEIQHTKAGLNQEVTYGSKKDRLSKVGMKYQTVFEVGKLCT